MKDPIKHGFYYVEYEYMGHKQNAVYFELKSAQEAMVKMMKKGVNCSGGNLNQKLC